MSDPVSLDNATRLLRSVRIAHIAKGGIRIPESYSGFKTELLVRIHLLPYLLPLKSERALAFELAERPELRKVVGLDAEASPTRATLWHFRRRNPRAFRQLMARSLALIAIESKKAGLDVPFVPTGAGTVELVQVDLAGADTFEGLQAGQQIRIMTAPAAEFDPDAAQLRFDLPGMGTASAIKPPKKVLLHEDVGLPLRVHWHVGGELFSLLIVEPDWLDAPNQPRDLGELLGRSGKDPYTACSVIVMRRSDSAGEEQVLLCKRRMGAGVGTFALPGGKKNEGESIRACAARELKEEVGLRFRDGRPISINVTEEPGFPRVTSIGIVATAWDGEPRNREHLAHTRWEWFSLNKLPRPLFFPTELVLSDFILNRFPDLSWEKVGEDMSLPLWENQGRPKWTR